MENQITSFYEDLINNYSLLRFPGRYDEISKLNKHIAWYLADSNDYFVSSKQKNNTYIIEVDIRSAFTTICNILFKQDSKFVQEMNNIEDKKGRNIYISTTLTGEQLKILNNICKIIIFGIIFDSDIEEDRESITVLELKKDGILVSCSELSYNRLQHLNELGGLYTNYLLSHGFQFHTTIYQKYVRSNKTSVFLQNNEVIVKGQYKHIPLETQKIMKDILLEKDVNLFKLKQIYSYKVWDIIRCNILREHLDKFYLCNNKIINNIGKYVPFTNNVIVNPSLYLKIFVFPSILLNKME